MRERQAAADVERRLMLPERLEVVLLDFDHTLADLGDFVRWAEARAQLLPLYRAGGVPEAFLESHAGALNLYRDVAASGLLPEAELREVQRHASQILDGFEAAAIPRTSVFPAALGLVENLPKRGLRAGIVTANSTDVVRAVLERDGMAGMFGGIIGRAEVVRLKPSPEGLMRCCKMMGVSPSGCIYVGDSPSDIEAARGAGMPGFGVLTGRASAGELTQAEAVFNDLAALIAVLGLRPWTMP